MEGSELIRCRRDQAIRQVHEQAILELQFANLAFQPFNSAHEGYAVMLEEVDELWDLVKVNQKRRDILAMRKEAIQIAAMAMRFVIDCCESEGAGFRK